MIKYRSEDEVVRRLVAVVDRPHRFQFFGEHVFEAGTEFVIGDGEGRAQLSGGDLVLTIAPECVQRIPFGAYHLETETENRKILIQTSRSPTRLF
jgi:hypothetical protein